MGIAQVVDLSERPTHNPRMAAADRLRWNDKFTRGEVGHASPANHIVECLASIPPGVAADLACGKGPNAAWLASRGWRVLAVDISEAGLAIARRTAAPVAWVQADLDRFALRPASLDLLVSTYFLDRARWPEWRTWVRPGGWVYIETFTRAPTLRGDFLLAPGEAPSLLPAWEIARSFERDEGERSYAVMLAQRPA